MNYIVEQVSFNNKDIVNLKSEETWRFTKHSITTPNGVIKIDNCHKVYNNQFVGVQLSAWMTTIRLNCYDGYVGDKDMSDIKTVAFVRQPHNVWIWVYLIDENGETIATFCGHEEHFNDFAEYIGELYDFDYSAVAHIKAEKYKIIEIHNGCSHSKYGCMDIILANPVENNGFFESYIPYCNTEDTENFFIKDKNLVDRLDILAQGGGFWSPNPEDFEDEMCRDENTGMKKRVHLHRSLTHKDYISGGDFGIPDETPSELMTRLIPNLMSKKEVLEDQWQRCGMYYAYPSLRDYVSHLGTDNGVKNFFGWLFDDQRYNGYKETDLPDEHLTAYENFLKLFFSLDE